MDMHSTRLPATSYTRAWCAYLLITTGTTLFVAEFKFYAETFIWFKQYGAIIHIVCGVECRYLYLPKFLVAIQGIEPQQCGIQQDDFPRDELRRIGNEIANVLKICVALAISNNGQVAAANNNFGELVYFR